MKIGNIWKIGIRENMDLEVRKRVMFSNGVYIIVGFIILLQEAITGIDSIIPWALIALAALCLALNSFQFYLLSRVLFMISWTFLVSIFIVITRGPSPTTYFTHPFYIILSTPLIHLLFSYQKERFIFFFFLVISFSLTLFSIDFLLAFDPAPEPKVPLVNSTGIMRITFAILWLYLNMLMVYVLKINWDFYTALQGQTDLVGEQRLLLQRRNEELSEANKELGKLNAQIQQLNEILEKRVLERTQELTDRNKTLSDYAFMNAHLLRSPVSRIKGLINLFRITNDPEEKTKIQQILMQSAEELDEVVHSISQKLNETK